MILNLNRNDCIRKNGVYLLLDNNFVNLYKCCRTRHNKIAQIPIKELLENDSFEIISKYYYESNVTFIKYNCLLAGKYSNCILDSKKLDCFQISLGKLCNHNCIMCYAANINEHHDTKMHTILYYKILNDIKYHKLKCIYLTDIGEPFLYKDTIDWLESLDKNLIGNVSCATNLTSLSRKDFDRIENLLVDFDFTISFISLITNSLDYDIFFDNLNYIKNKKLKYHFNVLLTDLNKFEESDIINYLNDNFPNIDYVIVHAKNGVTIDENE